LPLNNAVNPAGGVDSSARAAPPAIAAAIAATPNAIRPTLRHCRHQAAFPILMLSTS
jgi:hypothetical protein